MLGINPPGQKVIPFTWPGHLAVISAEWLLDPTVNQVEGAEPVVMRLVSWHAGQINHCRTGIYTAEYWRHPAQDVGRDAGWQRVLVAMEQEVPPGTCARTANQPLIQHLVPPSMHCLPPVPCRHCGTGVGRWRPGP